MGYRIGCVPPERSVNNETTLSKIVLSNGTIANYAFPCFYVEIPEGADLRCSGTWDEDSEVDLIPINLSEEGYTDVDVVFSGSPSGITASGSIDAINDNIIRVKFSASCPDAERKPLEIQFSIFVTDGSDVRDIACRGIIVVLPGPYAA